MLYLSLLACLTSSLLYYLLACFPALLPADMLYLRHAAAHRDPRPAARLAYALQLYYLLTCFTYVMQPLIVIRDRLLVSHHRRYLALLAAHLQVSVFVLLSVTFCTGKASTVVLALRAQKYRF
jgi:hypothetical protein